MGMAASEMMRVCLEAFRNAPFAQAAMSSMTLDS